MKELSQQNSSSLTYLILEEECPEFEYFKGLLELNGINVHLAKNKEEADELCENNSNIDLVLKICPNNNDWDTKASGIKCIPCKQTGIVIYLLWASLKNDITVKIRADHPMW